MCKYDTIDKILCPLSLDLCIYGHENAQSNNTVSKNGCIIIELDTCCKECYLCIIPFTCILDLLLCPFTFYSNYNFYNKANRIEIISSVI